MSSSTHKLCFEVHAPHHTLNLFFGCTINIIMSRFFGAAKNAAEGLAQCTAWKNTNVSTLATLAPGDYHNFVQTCKKDQLRHNCTKRTVKEADGPGTGTKGVSICEDIEEFLDSKRATANASDDRLREMKTKIAELESLLRVTLTNASDRRDAPPPPQRRPPPQLVRAPPPKLVGEPPPPPPPPPSSKMVSVRALKQHIGILDLNRAVEKLIFLTIISRNGTVTEHNHGLEACANSPQSEFRSKCIPDNATARRYFEAHIYLESKGTAFEINSARLNALFSRAWGYIEIAAKKRNVSGLGDEKPPIASNLALLKWDFVSNKVMDAKDKTWTEYCPRKHAEFIAQLMHVASFDPPTLELVIQLIEDAYHLKGLSELMLNEIKTAKKHDSKSVRIIPSHLNCDAHAQRVCDSHKGCGWDESIGKCQEATHAALVNRAVTMQKKKLDDALVKQKEKLDATEKENQNPNGREDALDGRAPPPNTALNGRAPPPNTALDERIEIKRNSRDFTSDFTKAVAMAAQLRPIPPALAARIVNDGR